MVHNNHSLDRIYSRHTIQHGLAISTMARPLKTKQAKDGLSGRTLAAEESNSPPGRRGQGRKTMCTVFKVCKGTDCKILILDFIPSSSQLARKAEKLFPGFDTVAPIVNGKVDHEGTLRRNKDNPIV